MKNYARLPLQLIVGCAFAIFFATGSRAQQLEQAEPRLLKVQVEDTAVIRLACKGTYQSGDYSEPTSVTYIIDLAKRTVFDGNERKQPILTSLEVSDGRIVFKRLISAMPYETTINRIDGSWRQVSPSPIGKKDEPAISYGRCQKSEANLF
jgi:hypothetical protein